MSIPTTGTVSFSQINTELGRSAGALISLDTAENGGYATINSCSSSKPSSGNPATIGEWRGYNHLATCTIYDSLYFEIAYNSTIDSSGYFADGPGLLNGGGGGYSQFSSYNPITGYVMGTVYSESLFTNPSAGGTFILDIYPGPPVTDFSVIGLMPQLNWYDVDGNYYTATPSYTSPYQYSWSVTISAANLTASSPFSPYTGIVMIVSWVTYVP